MKQLIPINEHGLFCDTSDTARVDSRYVAHEFEKRHDNVLQAIQTLLAPNSGLSVEFGLLNFKESSYINEQNKRQPCYAMTRDGFTLLVMGFTGKKALHFKEAYIGRFNEMEATIKELVASRMQFPLLTENIALLHENPKPYHFSNECDMINRLVLGMTAKQFREKHGLSKNASIRPLLTQEQLTMIERLQYLDTGLLLSTPDFQQRKHFLEGFLTRKALAW